MTSKTPEQILELAGKEIPCPDVSCNNHGMTKGGENPQTGEPEPLQCEFCCRRDDFIRTLLSKQNTPSESVEGIKDWIETALDADAHGKWFRAPNFEIIQDVAELLAPRFAEKLSKAQADKELAVEDLVDALETYLNAGHKEARREASIKAKRVLQALTPKNTGEEIKSNNE